VMHAELSYGSGAVMLGSKGRGGAFDRAMAQAGPSGVYVVVDDVDAHHRRAVEHGVEILMEPTDQEYGSRDYMARDGEGNVWSFGTYAPQV
ncbi:VOC family protein, partial [Streptomyces sp. NPDC048551]